MSEAKEITTTTPAQLLTIAVEQNADLDKLEKLMALQERWEANEAKKAYVAAMSEFRAKAPALDRTRPGHNIKYAGLAESIEQIKMLLSDCGLSHSWRTAQDNDRITVTCCVTHIQGHQECTSLSGEPDSSGSKNKIQAVGSTVSYLERYTLWAILGLASKEMDDDGVGGAVDVEYISDEQANAIDAQIREDQRLDMEKFLRWLSGPPVKAQSIAEIGIKSLPIVEKMIADNIRRHAHADS